MRAELTRETVRIGAGTAIGDIHEHLGDGLLRSSSPIPLRTGLREPVSAAFYAVPKPSAHSPVSLAKIGGMSA